MYLLILENVRKSLTKHLHESPEKIVSASCYSFLFLFRNVSVNQMGKKNCSLWEWIEMLPYWPTLENKQHIKRACWRNEAIHTVYLWFSIQCCRQTHCFYHMLHTGCGQQYALLSVTRLTENKYYIYNFTAVGNFKLLQLKCGLVH